MKTWDARKEDNRRSTNKCRLARGWGGRASGYPDLQDAGDLPRMRGRVLLAG